MKGYFFPGKSFYLSFKSPGMDWPIIIIVAAIVLGLLIFINVYNRKDKKDLLDKLKKDYRKRKDEENDTSTEANGSKV